MSQHDTLDSLRAEYNALLQQLTDEQNAHKLTAETLTKAIRDGDKADHYRVEYDKAMRVLRKVAATNCSHGNPNLHECGPCMALGFIKGMSVARGFDVPDDPPTGSRRAAE